MRYERTDKQDLAFDLLATKATDIMLYGGSRSGKTFAFIEAIIARAIRCKSRHAILRQHFNHCKQTIWYDTLPKVMDICYPGLQDRCVWSKADWYVKLPNKSEIWIGGLDDKDRTEKILGSEYSTLYFNECSQISEGSVDIAKTRLAEKNTLMKKSYYDCVSGDTILDGHIKTIEQLTKEGVGIKVMTTYGSEDASIPWMNGIGQLYLVTTASGHKIEVTASHRFWTRQGWKRLDEISLKTEILCSDRDHFVYVLQGVYQLRRRVEGWLKSCYKYLRRCDEQSLQVEENDQVYLASSYDEEQHSQSEDFSYQHHDELNLNKAHHIQHEVQCSHHNLKFHKLLYLKFVAVPLHKVLFFLSKVSLLFPCVFLFCQKFLLKSFQTLSFLKSHSVSQSSCKVSSDTPNPNFGFYSMVESIIPTTTKPYYTIEVPSVKHYIANGIVSHNCNPPKRSHWTYRKFIEQVTDDGEKMKDWYQYKSMLMNPYDNIKNIDSEYITNVLDKLPPLLRQRFRDGLWVSDDTDIFKAEWLLPHDTRDDDIAAKFTFIDPANTSKEMATENTCESAVVTVGVTFEGLVVDLEVLHGMWSYGELKAKVQSAYERHCKCSNYTIGVEDVGSQKWLSTDLAEMGVSCSLIRPINDKVTRAISVTDLLEQGRCRVNDNYLRKQLLGFPGEKLKDMVDAYVYCLKMVKEMNLTYERAHDKYKALDGASRLFWENYDKEHEPPPNNSGEDWGL